MDEIGLGKYTSISNAMFCLTSTFVLFYGGRIPYAFRIETTFQVWEVDISSHLEVLQEYMWNHFFPVSL